MLPESKEAEYKPLESVTNDKKPDIEDEEGPTDTTSQIAAAAVALIVVGLTGFCALLIAGWDALGDRDAWAIFTAVLLGFLIIFGVVVMQLQPKNNAKFPFTVPCIPVLPIASVIVNLFLLLKLAKWTWVRFGVWMVIGKALLYFPVYNLFVFYSKIFILLFFRFLIYHDKYLCRRLFYFF